ncbi:hypothetical protein D9619_007844 [Psilocybe cf. subviscida]|uniref:CBM1 domain-containing protein n=1 Tax=Psilocybe cf. subviscida TaxID=2480587 RepID=A0A8H5ESB0_9AGAR|nr:hypothetical protein D9619_007844 [Psilocybe cf. subviscida]
MQFTVSFLAFALLSASAANALAMNERLPKKSSTTITSTTRSSTTTVTSTPTPTATPIGTPLWGQCGGQGYTGPTVCQPPGICTCENPYHSNCFPPEYDPGPSYC